MDRSGKQVTGILGVLIGAATTVLVAQDILKDEPNLKVYQSRVEFIKESSDSTELIPKLEEIEDKYSAYTSYHIIGLIDDLEYADQSDESGAVFEDSQRSGRDVRQSIESVQEDLNIDLMNNQAQIQRLIGSLQELGLAANSPTLDQVISELGRLELEYYVYSESFLTDLIEELKFGESNVVDSMRETVSDLQQYTELIDETRKTLSQELTVVREHLVTDNKGTLFAQLTIENHSRSDSVVRTRGALSIKRERTSFPDLHDVNAESDVEIRGHSIARATFSLDIKSDAKLFSETTWLENAECIVFIEDLHGNSWNSEVKRCADSGFDRGEDSFREQVREKLREIYGVARNQQL